MKYLLLLAVVLGVVWWLRRALPDERERGERTAQRRPWWSRRPPAREEPQASTRSAVREEALVACAHCGVLLPKSDAVEGEGGFYCCDEHRRLGPR